MEDDVALEYQRTLRHERRKNAALAESERDETAGPSEEDEEIQEAAVNAVTALGIMDDLLGWIPFIGGFVRFILGILIAIQSFKLGLAVRMKAWVINGVITVAEIALSFFGLNELPLETIGVILIRILASNASREKTKQPE